MPGKRAATRDENRSAPRRRVLKAGTIEFGRSAFSCVVRDRSDTGAKLDVPSPIGIPGCFVLFAEGSRLPCHVVWRKENRIGIAFD
jgi:hypothetical protein